MYVPSSYPTYGWMLKNICWMASLVHFYFIYYHIYMSIFKVRSDILRRISNNICHLCIQTRSFERNSKKGAQQKLLQHQVLAPLGSLWLLPMGLSSQSLCGMQGWAVPPQGKDSGRLDSSLPFVSPSRLPRDYSCLVNCLLLLSYPEHYLPRAVRFEQHSWPWPRAGWGACWQMMKAES